MQPSLGFTRGSAQRSVRRFAGLLSGPIESMSSSPGEILCAVPGDGLLKDEKLIEAVPCSSSTVAKGMPKCHEENI